LTKPNKRRKKGKISEHWECLGLKKKTKNDIAGSTDHSSARMPRPEREKYRRPQTYWGKKQREAQKIARKYLQSKRGTEVKAWGETQSNCKGIRKSKKS